MHKVIHFEIPSSDPDRSKLFYEKVFGWTYTQMPGQQYWMTNSGTAKDEGINGAIMLRNDPAQPVTVNVKTESVDESLLKVQGAGGVTVVPRTAIPGMGAFAYFKDPDGYIVGVWEFEKTVKPKRGSPKRRKAKPNSRRQRATTRKSRR